jgi:protein-tyrosine phosphatase
VDTATWRTARSRHGGVDEVPLPTPTGRLWLCGKHFVGPDPERALATVGATVVVCLNEREELVDRYPAYVEWLRRHVPERVVWHPVPDLHAPEPAAARLLLTELEERLADGAGLLVHCGAGMGRAGTVAAGLLVTMGASVDEAIATVAAHRPMAGPEAGAQSELLATLTGP